MNTLKKCLLISIFQIVVIGCSSYAAAAAPEFMWSNSNYGRGVGTIPQTACTNPKYPENDAALCYEPCTARDGHDYIGVGPVCWEKSIADQSYPRGAGSVPNLSWDSKNVKFKSSCSGGKQNDSGLCYDHCRSGYYGKGPVCWSNSPVSYGRGAGQPLVQNCNSGQQLDAGLCYDQCRDGYTGAGPVCWGNAPRGYVMCGMGFATDGATCARVLGNQIASVGFLAGDYTFLGAGASDSMKNGINAGKYTTTALSLMTHEIGPAVSTIRPIADQIMKDAIKKMANLSGGPQELLDSINKIDSTAMTLASDSAKKFANAFNAMDNFKSGGSSGSTDIWPTTPLDQFRAIATIFSMIPAFVMAPGFAYMDAQAGQPEVATLAYQQAALWGDFWWVISAYAYPKAP